MTKTWLAEELFTELAEFYRDAEQITGASFYFPMPIYRPFLGVAEQNDWMGKQSDAQYTSFVREVLTGPTVTGVHDNWGGLLLANSGFVDCRAYVEAVRALVKEHHTYREGPVDTAAFAPENDGIRYGSYTASHVVIAAGVHGDHWFGWLPVRPLKGETFTAALPLVCDWIVNRGVYVVPAGSRWRVGATYSHNDHEPGVTEGGRQILVTQLEALVDGPVEITEQQWGVRPTTPDRRPLLGRHPEHGRLWVFNGLGTKGVSLAPYFSKVLIDGIENGRPLNKDVDIERYKSLYWPSVS